MKLEALLAHCFPTQRVQYGPKDVILYALSVGAGADPADPEQLELVYEQNLRALPTLAAVLAHPGAWIANPVFEVNFLKLLHGEQNLTVHQPLPAGGEIEASYRVPAVVDKGEGKGVLVHFEKQLRSAAGGELLCTVSSTLFLRADGGCGSFGTPPDGLSTAPPGPIDFSDEITTPINSALLYRLNGDLNPIHVDPVAARKAGFERPILHGLCTYGVVGYLLVRSVCGHDPARLRSLGARFSSPVYPGETIRVEGCRSDGGVNFQATVPERQQVVLSQGYARIG
jgi:acyl dehydratase